MFVLAATGSGDDESVGPSDPTGSLTVDVMTTGDTIDVDGYSVVAGGGGGTSVVDGAVVGLMLGVGVAAMEGLKPAVYNFDERADPWTLYGINTLYAVCGLTLSGVVYALIA